MVLLHLHKLLLSFSLTSPVLYPLFLMKKWQVCVISLRMCPTTIKQLFRCTAPACHVRCTATCHVRCPPRIMSQMVHHRKDSICTCTHDGHVGTLHLTTNGLLRVAVVLGPSAMFTFVFLQPVLHESARCLDRHWSCFLLVNCSCLALMDPYALKWTSSEATRSPNMRTTLPNNDFTALFFQEGKWPSTSSGSTVAIVSCAKTRAAHLLVWLEYVN